MKNDGLFTEFEGFSKSEWKSKIIEDLKGKPYESLIKKNAVGIELDPVFSIEDRPSNSSFCRGTKSVNNDWWVTESILLGDNPEADNQKILKLLNSGLTGLHLIGTPEKATLKSIDHQYIALEFGQYSELKEVIECLKNSFGEQPNNSKIYLNYDPYTKAAQTGLWKPEDSQQIKETVKLRKSLQGYSSTRLFTIGGNVYHNCGAGPVAEIGLALAQAHEYLLQLMQNGYGVDEAAAEIKIDLAAGRDYFTEIAKFRAFKIMWARLIEAYKPEKNESLGVDIKAYTSTFWSTVYDPYVNMLRATTQAMSAAIGGVDLMEVTPYNATWENGSSFSNRIARNVQLLLKEETYLDKVIDPAGGSYFIESLTNDIAEKAWLKFQKIEKKGGFLGLVTSGNLQRELKEEAQVQIKAFENDELQILGVNLYPNSEEHILDKLATVQPDASDKNSDFPPIEQVRVAGQAEQERATKELEGKS